MPEQIAFRKNLNLGQAVEYETRHNNVPTQIPLKRVVFLP